jgi:16S rRNA (uracil1498-N3)-methyltransferase
MTPLTSGQGRSPLPSLAPPFPGNLRLPMNLVLFEPAEIGPALPGTDPRVRHVQEVLRLAAGDPFDAGLVNVSRGKASLHPLGQGAFRVDYTPGIPLPPRPSLRLMIGLPRPQTARDILRDATTLGATQLHFVLTERSDRNYASSTLWSSGEWRRHVLAGAAQAFDPRIPDVRWATPLDDVPPVVGDSAWALDAYEATVPLAAGNLAPEQAVVLAIGPERGWGPADRAMLRDRGFILAALDLPVLRVETAVVAALTLVAAARARA